MVLITHSLLLWVTLPLLIHVKSYEHSAKYSTSRDQETIFNMTNTTKHLFWFIQISDLHLSSFREVHRINDFKVFCNSTINVIKPTVVIASGDLTDGKSINDIGTYQIKSEWVQYYNILKENNIVNKTLWMDIRGNHDGFNIISLNSSQNYFINYSIQGQKNHRSYLKQLHKDDNIYSFVALDSCLDPGQRRPFHFVGYLDKREVVAVKNIISQIEATSSNFSIWFGHFPTSAILAEQDSGVRGLISEDAHSLVYLSGHFHTFGGIVPRMYALHSEGFLELELGDWKANRLFRLLAFDHGLLSFTDVRHNDWPIIVVTNPKHALFVVPQKENVDIMKQSTYVRVLIFSPSEIEWIKIKINNEDWKECVHVEGPLYVSKWNSDRYFQGLHTLYVHARDVDGREKVLSQPFTLDGLRLSFGFLPNVALKSNVNILCKTTFGIMFVVSILPLSILKFLNILVRKGKLDKPKLKGGCCGQCFRKLWILTTIDRIFWPLWLYPIYLTIGPWSIGFIIEDYWGVFFTWGIIVNGAFLPGSITYACAAIQLLLFYVPLTIILSNAINERLMNLAVRRTNRYKTVIKYLGLHLPFLLVICLQVFGACYFLVTFGFTSFIFGILPTWSAFFAIILWHKAFVLPESCTSEAARFWSIKIEPEPIQNYLSLPNVIGTNADSAL